MEVIERQQPKIIHMAPVCGPWSQMQNINDPSDTYQKRKKYLPMVEFCARVALYQIEHGRYSLKILRLPKFGSPNAFNAFS